MVNPHDGLPDQIKAILPDPVFCFYSGHWHAGGWDREWICDACFDTVLPKGEWVAMYWHRRWFIDWEHGIRNDLVCSMAGYF